MYSSVRLSILDQHTHRFLWRNMEINREPDHYILQRMAFGDKPSGAIAALAMRKTAHSDRENFPGEVHAIDRNSYVDDLLQSVDDRDVLDFTRNVEEILLKGGFMVKHWIISAAFSQSIAESYNIIQSEKERVLGMVWDPSKDSFHFHVKLNFSKKWKNTHVEPDLNKDNVQASLPVALTRRMALSQMSKIYDPLGLITPVTLEGKLLMREICAYESAEDKKLGWDAELPEHLRDKWKYFFIRMFEIQSLSFQRCVKPDLYLGNLTLVIFDDASGSAYGAAAYLRWQVRENDFASFLVIAKNRLAPMKAISIPRLELCGAVLSVRLRRTIEEEMDCNFESVIHITDSMIVRAQIQKESYSFQTFVSNRISEIQDKSSPSEWYWIRSELNIADWTTRVRAPEELNSESIWQTGPSFLKLPKEEWPTTQSYECKDLPDSKKVVLTVSCVNGLKFLNFEDINVSRFRKPSILINVVAILLKIRDSKKFKGFLNSTEQVEYLEKARVEWYKYCQSVYHGNWKSDLKRLGPQMDENGVIVVGERLTQVYSSWNSKLPVIIPKGEYAKLIAKSVHEEGHLGVDSTVAKIRNEIWIPGVRKIVKGVRKACIRCRILDKEILEQKMGQLPIERLTPSPAFYHTSLDLFGPYNIRDMVKRRSTAKAYGVIFNCLYSRAVYLDLIEGYDARCFKLSLRRFVAMRGYPKRIFSDLGSQLVSASKDLRDYTGLYNLIRLALCL